MNILFSGDFIPIYPVRFECNGILIGNLECAFADVNINNLKAYTSVLTKDKIDFISKTKFSALSLANNHTYDANNFDAVYNELKERFPKILFFGTKKVPYASFGDIAIIGCLERSRSRGSAIFPEEKVIDLLKVLRNKYNKIYIYPHWGKEGEYTRWPSPEQLKLAHRWIDCGADGIFGSHSHVFQGKEIYRDKPIYYSLGNFYFPHEESKSYNDTSCGIVVSINNDTASEKFYSFNDKSIFTANKEINSKILLEISSKLLHWNLWGWAKAVGPLYLSKNTNSWKIRLKKNLFRSFPLFCIWRVMPKTLLFRIASLFAKREHK